MRKTLLRGCLIVLGVALIAAWPLFGWETRDTGSGTIVRYHRFFGRITRISADVDRDGRIDGEMRYFWSQPYRGAVDVIGPCSAPYRDSWEDRDRDGQPDLWIRQLHSGGGSNCATEVNVDLDRDGKPDWTFTATNGDDIMAVVKEKRGW